MRRNAWCQFILISLIFGCASQPNPEIEIGTSALRSGNPEAATIQFLKISQTNPDYVVDDVPLRLSIWNYLGRAHYESKKYPEARGAFTEAAKRDKPDFVARLYLGVISFRAALSSQQPSKPLTLENLKFALKERISNPRIVSLIKERGTNFELTPEMEQELRGLNADHAVIEQIRMSNKERALRISKTSQPALIQIERALRDFLVWQQKHRASSEGALWDEKKQLAAQINSSLLQIKNNRTNSPEFVTGLENLGRLTEDELAVAKRR